MARVKIQKGEKINDENIERVIKLLDEGGDKNDAYDILNIKKNPGRLQRIIDEYLERLAIAAKLRKANRGVPARDNEIQSIIRGALDGESISGMADDLFRSPQFVKDTIDKIGIPQKLPGSWWDRRTDTSIPDKCVSDSFKQYEIVWSNKYNGLAIVLHTNEVRSEIYVIEKIEEEADFAIGGKVYTGYGGFHSTQRNEELGSLEHLKEHGVDIYRAYQPHFPNWLGSS